MQPLRDAVIDYLPSPADRDPVTCVEPRCGRRRSSAESGPLSGSPVVDVEVTLLGGAYHPNDSSELADEAAFKSALRAASRFSTSRS